MTREEVKQCAEIMMEYANGKTVQCAVKTVPNEWKDITDDDSPVFNFAICNYRIKPEDKEPTYRPYKDCDEMIDDFYTRFGVIHDKELLPLIWVKYKETGSKFLITFFGEQEITASCGNWSLRHASDNFTYLDGSPCGKLEEE